MDDMQKIDRLKEIKNSIEELKTEQDRLEGELILSSMSKLENTKYKTVTYRTKNGSSATVTLAESLKIVYPSILKSIFGAAYKDIVKSEVKYSLTAAGKRMMTGIWTGKYIRLSLEEAVYQLPVDESTRKKLAKKLKGIKFDTDKKNLMNIGGMSEQDAAEYAYMIMEAATWEQFETLLRLNGITEEQEIKKITDLINTAMTVDETPKISVE